MITKDDLTIIYYTSNFLEETNPKFLAKTEEQLVKAIDDLPLIVVSQKPVSLDQHFPGYKGEYKNICIGEVGRSHLNIYRQLLIGAKEAKTPFIATAEDDILYSFEHFNSQLPKGDYFLYDMNKLSLFTWTKPPMYSFRHNRMVVNQLISPTKLIVEAMEERFAKYPVDSEAPIKYWGDPGRYERLLKVTPRATDTFMCTCPSIVFSHEYAYGYLSQGRKKRIGDLRIIEVPYWGKAEDVLKKFYE